MELVAYGGYGDVQDEIPDVALERQQLYEERLARATEAAMVAASQAEINAALAAQAQETNHSIIMGFVGTGAVGIMVWALSMAFTHRKR